MQLGVNTYGIKCHSFEAVIPQIEGTLAMARILRRDVQEVPELTPKGLLSPLPNTRFHVKEVQNRNVRRAGEWGQCQLPSQWTGMRAGREKVKKTAVSPDSLPLGPSSTG